MSSETSPSPPSKKIGCRGCLLILLTGFFLFLAFAGIWILTAFNSAPQPGQPLFAPSIAANYVTSPLDANGDVDYLEFINQDASQDVTPQNNAMVKIVEAIGPLDGVPADFYFRLGITTPPANGTYFVDLEDWYKSWALFDEDAELKFLNTYNSNRSFAVWDYAIYHPWTPEQFPGLAAYMKDHEPVLRNTVAASQRQNYYAPVVVESANDPIFSALLSYQQETRDLARLLTVRSNLNLATGKTQQAIEDAFAVVRLGEKLCTSNTLVEGLIGMAIRGIGFRQLVSIARRTETSIDDLLRLRDSAKQLRLINRVSTVLSQRERLIALDATTKLIRNGYANEGSYYFGDDAAAMSMLAKTGDAEAAMTEVNSLYDESKFIFEQGKTDPSFDVEQAFVQIGNRIDFETANPMKNYFLLLRNKQARGQQLGKVLGSLMLPLSDAVWRAERRVNSELNLLRMTIEIEIFKRKNGSPPETLDQLAPTQLTEIPSDPYARLPSYGYRKTDSGYRVYSFGPNQTDDDGRNPMQEDYENEDDNGDADDWFFEETPPMTWQEFLDDRYPPSDLGMGLGGFETSPNEP
jgi:hypothetical protein